MQGMLEAAPMKWVRLLRFNAKQGVGMTGKSPQECLGMEDIRAEIDRRDRKIIALLGERAGYVHAAAAFKTSEDGVRAP